MKIVRSVILFFSGFAAILIICEIFLSYSGIMSPIVKIDKEKGERYYSDKLCNSMFAGGEGFGLAKTNSDGWFGKEFQDIGDMDISVAVTGNSFIASRQVFTRDNFLSIAEKEINKKTKNLHTTFYNFGKESMPIEELLFVKNEIDSMYNPDYIVVFMNNYTFESPLHRSIPYYELKNDSLKLNTNFRNSLIVQMYSKFRYFTQSSLVFMIYRVKNNFKNAPQIIFDKLYFTKKEIEQKGFKNKHKIALLHVILLKKLKEDKKVIFLLDIEDKQLSCDVKIILFDSQIIDLQKPFKELKTNMGINPYYWEIDNVCGHWNNSGHKVVGKILAAEVEKIIFKDLEKH